MTTFLRAAAIPYAAQWPLAAMLPTTPSTLLRSTAGSCWLDATMARTILTLLTLLLMPPAAHAQSSWVKLCEKANAITKDKDGKDEKKEG